MKKVLEAMLSRAEECHPEQVPEMKRRLLEFELGHGRFSSDLSAEPLSKTEEPAK